MTLRHRRFLRTLSVAGALLGALRPELAAVAAIPAPPHRVGRPGHGGAWTWALPAGFPTPAVPAANPMSAAKVDLGATCSTTSACRATARRPAPAAICRTRPSPTASRVSRGSTGEFTARSAQPLGNVAYNPPLTWANPSLLVLERQMEVPLFGENPIEMGINDGNKVAVLQRLADAALYAGQSLRPLSRAKPTRSPGPNVIKAIAAFQRSLISGNSRYDQMIAGKAAFTAVRNSAARELFFGDKAECSRCHNGFNFNDQVVHASRTVVVSTPFHNIGLYNVGGTGAYPEPNRGVIELSGLFKDMGAFRAPSLRNVAVTAPYMHDGSVGHAGGGGGHLRRRRAQRHHRALRGRRTLESVQERVDPAPGIDRSGQGRPCRLPEDADRHPVPHRSPACRSVQGALSAETAADLIHLSVSTRHGDGPMKFRLNCIAALCAALPVAALAQDDKTMGTVTVTEPRMLSPGETAIGETTLAPMRAATSDSARLLQDIPGVSLYGAGGISSLPAIHGLADDRLRIQVDGMDLMSACPNHMNSALSYIDPSRSAVSRYLPASRRSASGGDSIGGSIQVKSAPPEFADSAEKDLAPRGRPARFTAATAMPVATISAATLARKWLNLTYSESTRQIRTITRPAGDFKPAGPGRGEGGPLAGRRMKSAPPRTTARRTRDVGLALRHESHLLQLNVSQQNIPLRGVPEPAHGHDRQRQHPGQPALHGPVSAGVTWRRASTTRTPAQDGYGAGPVLLRHAACRWIPRENTGAAWSRANIVLSERDILRVAWRPSTSITSVRLVAAGRTGSMGPNTFWNIDYGQRENA